MTFTIFTKSFTETKSLLNSYLACVVSAARRSGAWEIRSIIRASGRRRANTCCWEFEYIGSNLITCCSTFPWQPHHQPGMTVAHWFLDEWLCLRFIFMTLSQVYTFYVLFVYFTHILRAKISCCIQASILFRMPQTAIKCIKS